MFVANFKQKPIYNKCKTNAYTSDWNEQLPEKIPVEFAEFIAPKKILKYKEKNIDEQIKGETYKMTDLALFSKLPIEKKQEMLNENKAEYKNEIKFNNLTDATNELTKNFEDAIKQKSNEITNKKILELQKQINDIKQKNETLKNQKDKINE